MRKDHLRLVEEGDEPPNWFLENATDLLAAFTLLLVVFYLVGDFIRLPVFGRPLVALVLLAGMVHFNKLPRLTVSLTLICLAVLLGALL